MVKVLKFLTTASIIIFLVVILVVYAFLPDPSGLLYNKEGYRLFNVSKNTFFYVTLFIFILLQVILFLFNKIILTNHRTIIMQHIETWFLGMRLAINLFIILLLVFIGLANNAIDFEFSSIIYLPYLAPMIVIIWLLALPVFIIRAGKNRIKT